MIPRHESSRCTGKFFLEDSRFPEVLIGIMSCPQPFANDDCDVLPITVEEVIQTMATEAAFESSALSGMRVKLRCFLPMS